MKIKAALIGFLLMACLNAQSDVESRVLQSVREMMAESKGRVTFSDLHNSDRFSAPEKAFLGRLYETFFRLPGYLKEEYQATGEAPSRRQIASEFDLSVGSVELLLRVMQSDPRVPPLFERDESTGEIREINAVNIDAFIASRGSDVRVTQWAGQTVPAFRLRNLEGGKLSSADLRGDNVLLYFWFSGCPPCVRIAPILAELDREYRDRGFRIIGINADRELEIEVSDEQRADYLAKSGTEYPNLELDGPTREAFGSINVYPTLFFVSPNGTIRTHLLNFQDRATLEPIILEMLGS